MRIDRTIVGLGIIRMVDYLESLPWSVSAFIMVFGYVLFSAGLLLCVRRFFDAKKVKCYHDVICVTFANLGVLYAVLVAFIFIEVEKRHYNVQYLIEEEAGVLANLYRDSSAFPDKVKEAIRGNLLAYAEHVLFDEWGKPAASVVTSIDMEKTNAIWQVYYDYKPATDQEKIWYQESISKLNAFNSHRVERKIQLRESLSPLLWALMVAGAILTTLFLSIFYIESFWFHLLLQTFLGGTIAFLLFIILSYDNPFLGGVQITPVAFHQLVDAFKKWNY